MSFVNCVVSVLLTVIIPFKLTHQSVNKKEGVKQWAIYWAVFSTFNGLFYLLPFLSEQPFNFVFVLFLVWLYHQTFRGSLLLEQLFMDTISKNEAITTNINMMAQKLQFLNLFESAQPFPKAKPE